MKLTNSKTAFVVVSICLIFVISQVSLVSAFSVRELLGLDKPDQEEVEKTDKKPKAADAKSTEETDAEWAKTSDSAAASNPQLDLEYFSLLVSNMNEPERGKLLSDTELFKQLVENEANNRSAVSAAISNKMEKDKNVQFLMRRGAESILRESYFNLLIANKLPADFPSKEQVSEYYENNKQQFIVPERVHVWQIFFKKSEGAGKKEITSLKKKANDIVTKIKKGKSDFSSVALSESEHEQSKILGGYMGLIKTNELLPEIKDVILKLKEDEISAAVESETGVHIVKRGKLLKAEPVQLAQVEDQIRKLLINQANVQLRAAIFTQARKEFPQSISDKKIEEWRLRLRTNTNQ